MGSHGVPRFAPPETQADREKEHRKITEYTSLVNLIKVAILEQHFTVETLDQTSRVLTINPEYYTAWNQRRKTLKGLFSEQQQSKAERQPSQHERIRHLLMSDLDFLLPLLMQYPKCYWIWNHRQWTLQQFAVYTTVDTTRRAWEAELGLVSKMLTRDSRNFHGWDYRRKVIAELRKYNSNDGSQERSNVEPEVTNTSLTEQEFAYTTKMINTNLSNFSAWHNRSKIIPRLLDERGATQEDRKTMFDDELSLIDNAVFTDPYDQSLWFYHAHLMLVAVGGTESSQGTSSDVFVELSDRERLHYLETEIEKISDLIDDCDDCKWIYQYLLEYVSKYSKIEGGNKTFSAQDMNDWLDRLDQLDPLRKGRWVDLRKQLSA